MADAGEPEPEVGPDEPEFEGDRASQIFELDEAWKKVFVETADPITEEIFTICRCDPSNATQASRVVVNREQTIAVGVDVP